jgi:hypothetical protein
MSYLFTVTFFTPLRKHVRLGGKTILHEPHQKLLDVVVSVLVDCASLKSYQGRGILTDPFDRTTKSMRTRFPRASFGNCLRHGLMKLPKKLAALASPVRRACRSRFHTLWSRARQRKGLHVFALGQRLRRFADHVRNTAGATNGARVRQWFHDKTASWSSVLADPQMPGTSTLLAQARHALDRKLFMMKGFHLPQGNRQAFLHGLAHL